MLMRRPASLFGDRWATAHELGDRGIGLDALGFRSIGLFGGPSAIGARGKGPGNRLRNPRAHVERFLRRPLGNRAWGWVRNVGLDAFRRPSIRIFGSGRQRCQKVGPANRPQCSCAPVHRSLRGSVGIGGREWRPRNRPRRPRASASRTLRSSGGNGATGKRLNSGSALSRVGFSASSEVEEQRGEGEGTDQPAPGCVGKTRTRTRIP